jgi:hypothetical protein
MVVNNGKLTLSFDRNGPEETVRVFCNERSFTIEAYSDMRVLEQVVTAALKGCLHNVLPKDEAETRASRSDLGLWASVSIYFGPGAFLLGCIF